MNRTQAPIFAAIGMACRLPMARDTTEYWRNLISGADSIKRFQKDDLKNRGVADALLRDPAYVKAASIIDDPELFDAEFFGFTPADAEILDPQHRILLECAWAALEDAGYDAERYSGTIGVFAGATFNTYLICNLLPAGLERWDPVRLNLANSADFLTTRISYKLNLSGPSHAVQSACSTSLVATHVGCQSLLHQKCDMALCGGVSINLALANGYRYLEGGIQSPDGCCRPFDASARGTVFGSGAGMILIKRFEDALRDGDNIRALILGSAVNNDGSLKVGYTAPSVDGQAAVIADALANAGVGADTITYVEAHGTATALGDPIEVRALTKAYRANTARKAYCALGSVKGNIGHLDAAAGIAGLIKTVLALEHRQIPASLHFERPNPEIDFASSPFFVNTQLRDWESPNGPRRAGVSAFGVGGTNAHVILEEAPARLSPAPGREWNLLVLSARTAGALEKQTENLMGYLRQARPEDWADIAYTTQVGRKVFEHRRAVVARSPAEAVAAIETRDPERVLEGVQEHRHRPVAFLFPGVGTQHVGIGRKLYAQEPVVREHVDTCARLLEPELGLDIRWLLYGNGQQNEVAAELRRVSVGQPALFTIEYALAQLWRSWGVQPGALLGHSMGEYVAACLAGVFSLSDALRLVARRSRLIEGLPSGAMLTVPLSEAEAGLVAGAETDLAAVNGPLQCVLSGSPKAIGQLEQRLSAEGMSCRRLDVERAFHSRAMEPILEALVREVERTPRSAPAIPYLSNLTGTWITPEQATSPEYWARHMRQTVRFATALEELVRDPLRIFLEVGPTDRLDRITQTVASGCAGATVCATSLVPQADPEMVLTKALGTLWRAGVDIDFGGHHRNGRGRLSLPGYPFERSRHWIHPALPANTSTPAEPVLSAASVPPMPPDNAKPRPKLHVPYIAPRDPFESDVAAIWATAFGIYPIGIDDNFFDLGGDSTLALEVIDKIRQNLEFSLSAAGLYECPTIRAITELIAGPETTLEGESAEALRAEKAAARRSYRRRRAAQTAQAASAEGFSG